MRLGREERQELVGYLSGEGLSIRAISTATGAAVNTVMRDIQQVSQLETPEETSSVGSDPRAITGLDGKKYTRPTLSLEMA